MKKGIVFVGPLALAAFALWWPLGFAYALFTALCGLILGAWTFNSGLAGGLVCLTASLAMGLITVVSVCVGLAPGAGTFAFGGDVPSLVLKLPVYGAASAQFSLSMLLLMFVPTVAGALLACWAKRKFGELQAEKLADMVLD